MFSPPRRLRPPRRVPASALSAIARCFRAAFLLRRSRQRRPRLPPRLQGFVFGYFPHRAVPSLRLPCPASALFGVARCFSAAFASAARLSVAPDSSDSSDSSDNVLPSALHKHPLFLPPAPAASPRRAASDPRWFTSPPTPPNRALAFLEVGRGFSSSPVALPRVCWFVFGWFPLRAVPGLRVPSPRQPFCRCAVLPRRIPLSRPLPAPRPFLPWGGVSAPPSTPRPLAASIPLIALIPLIPSPLQASPLPLRAASVLAVVARCFSAAFLLRRSRQRRPRSPAMPLIPLKSSSPRMPPLPLRLWGLSSGGCLPAATQSPVCLKRGFPLCRSPRGVSLFGVVRCFSAAFSPRRRDAKTSQRPLSLTLARI